MIAETDPRHPVQDSIWRIVVQERGGRIDARLWFAGKPVAFLADHIWFAVDDPSLRYVGRQVRNASAVLNIGMAVLRPGDFSLDTADPAMKCFTGLSPAGGANICLN